MLSRIKKKEIAGFKEFVSNLETTAMEKRVEIIQVAILEDPIYMEWVMENMITIDHVLKITTDEFALICKKLPNGIGVLARAFFKTPYHNKLIDEFLPRELVSDYKDAAEYVGDLKKSDQDAARFIILKTTRALQENDTILGPPWSIPPIEVLKEANKMQSQTGTLELKYENGVIAAKGAIIRNKRNGEWHHFFQNGNIMAKGFYSKGCRHGNWIFYYPDEKVRTEGEFIYDTKDGEWTEISKDGIKTIVTYDDGLRK